MGVINPSAQGKLYPIWQLLMNFSLFSMTNELDEDLDPGLRVSIIISCWISLESITKECLNEHIMTSYPHMEVPKRFKPNKGLLKMICDFFRKKSKVELEDLNLELTSKEKFATEANSQSWYKLLSLCNEIKIPIENNINNWDFAQNLYRLRNGLTHGKTIKIMKSNVKYLKDDISKDYIKSINYFNGKKIIDKNLIIKNQNIRDFLNHKLTDFIIIETANTIDNIVDKFPKTYVSQQWKAIRIK